MSPQLINRSPDLKQIRDQGYNLEIRSAILLIRDVPYVNSSIDVKRGTLVMQLDLAGDVTCKPKSHVAFFSGEYPCHADGRPIEEIRNESREQVLTEGVVVQHMFSAKPIPSGQYEDYYAKVTTYVAILSGEAQLIDPKIDARTFPVIRPEMEDDSVFNYLDTASSRAGITLVSKKLEQARVAIVGLGGTGSYVLDLIAKTPVREIHLFDGDLFLQHNAFRSPGAPSGEDLNDRPKKVTYFKSVYSKLHRGIVDHPFHINAENVEELRQMNFVFLCIDNAKTKGLIVQRLDQFGCGFVDVGMGILESDGSLGGIVRATTSTTRKRDHVGLRICQSENEVDDDYRRNIQIADLNALNAALAVIKWKKLLGFYRDLIGEHHTTYSIDCNLLTSDDRQQ